MGIGLRCFKCRMNLDKYLFVCGFEGAAEAGDLRHGDVFCFVRLLLFGFLFITSQH